jgi:hypothetical protein
MPPDRSYITRLRTDGGPSHDLLLLLDRHRVLTTDQVARATGTPVRTVRYRLDRLHSAKLVEYARPGRETGSAPRHWWLTLAGARLVAGVAPAEGKRPSAMFAGHAAAIAEVWLAFLEYGPGAGLQPVDWWPDRAGWQEWISVGQQRRLTPDAVLVVELPAGEAAAFIEVDLATMNQTQLRQKVGRYLQYADDRAWEGVWPHCPPLLLLTTTPARAQNWIRAAGKLVDVHRRGRGMDYRFAGRGAAGRDIAHAERLVIAACGLVRDPATAVTDPVWMLSEDAAGDVTLAELLGERLAAQAVADRWYAKFEAEAREIRRQAALLDVARDQDLADLLGDPVAADVLTRLVDHDAEQFTAAHPELAEQILAWWPHRGVDVDGARETIRAALRVQHERIWAEQARALLAAVGADVGDAEPRAAAAAAVLNSGRLLRPWEVDLGRHRSRAAVQAAQLGDWPARRDRDAEQAWQGMSWRARRKTSPAELAAAYDDANLLACDTCAIATPRQGEWETREPGDDCRACGRGHLIDYRRRDQVPTLADRLAALRDRLARASIP